MADLISPITLFVEQAIDWMSNFLTVIVSQPILFLFVIAVPLVGIGVGLLNRLIRAN